MRLMIVIALFFTSGTFAQESILGTWLIQNKNAKIQIYKTNDKCFGKIVWIKMPMDMNNKPRTDSNNPDEKLRSRKINGLDILSNFVYNEDNEWTDGEIYNPSNGKTYSSNMKLVEDHLEIGSYVIYPCLVELKFGRELSKIFLTFNSQF